MRRTADPETPNELARYEAQKLAFAPLVFQGARAMRDLGVLGALYRAADAGRTAEQVESELELGDYATRVLLEAGYAAGLCAYEEPRFTITKTGVYFLTDRLTRVNTDFSHHVCYAPARHLADSLREGLPVGLRELGTWPTVYEGLRELPEDVKKAWFDFDHHYSDGVFETCLDTVLSPRPKYLEETPGASPERASRHRNHPSVSRWSIYPGRSPWRARLSTIRAFRSTRPTYATKAHGCPRAPTSIG
jgi:hypothetical protein